MTLIPYIKIEDCHLHGLLTTDGHLLSGLSCRYIDAEGIWG